VTTRKNREAGFGPASDRLAETFSLKKVAVLTSATAPIDPAFYS